MKPKLWLPVVALVLQPLAKENARRSLYQQSFGTATRNEPRKLLFLGSQSSAVQKLWRVVVALFPLAQEKGCRSLYQQNQSLGTAMRNEPRKRSFSRLAGHGIPEALSTNSSSTPSAFVLPKQNR